MKTRVILALALLAGAMGWGTPCRAQSSVVVTVLLDQGSLQVGQSTTLRVLAAIKPALTNQTTQIFSWYLDLLNASTAVARADASSLRMTNSDNIASTTSSGQVQQANIRGIHNTFMNKAHAGWGAAVELLSIPVVATKTGTVAFSVQPGSTVTNLAYDFIVATTNVIPLTGGDYAAATAVLTVTAASTFSLSNFPISCSSVSNGMRITYAVSNGVDYTVQYRTNLLRDANWTSMPGSPHNSGAYVDTNKLATRFYRVVGNGQ